MWIGTKNIRLRTIDELNENERTIILDKRRYNETETSDWADWITDDFMNEMESVGWSIKKNTLVWDAQYAKIGFEGWLNIEKFGEAKIKNFKVTNKTFKELRSVTDDLNCHSVVGRREHSSELEIDDITQGEFTTNINFKKFTLQWEQVKDEIEFHYSETLKKFGKMLEETLEEITSDKYLIERIRDDDELFDDKLDTHNRNEFVGELREVKE